LLDLATGDKISVGAPYFNRTFGPIFALVALVAGIGPLLTWKRADARALVSRLRFVLLAAFVAPAAWAAINGWREPLGLAGLALAGWLMAATLADLGQRAGLGRASLLQAAARIAGLPRSAWGLYAGHAGLAVCIAGVAAVSAWKVEAIQTQAPGHPVQVGAYEFTLTEVGEMQGPNYRASVATVAVTRDGAEVARLRPERRWYPVERKPTTEAGIRTLWHGDLYAVLGDPAGDGAFVTRYYYNPGVAWMWAGAAIMALGGLLTISDRRLRIGAPAARRPGAAAQAA
jgi:cytochrome c-type biogenesis protein CcmF